MSFFSSLESRAQVTGSLLCVGLDPHRADLARSDAQGARDFCLRLIETTADLAAAFKPNAAFFEALGVEGISVLQQVIAAVPDSIPVILDAKRGDIASTAQAYAKAAFEVLRADAVTANPYLGRDALSPFLEDPQHGVFLLCKTSNPGAGDLQDLRVLPAQPGGQGSLLLYEVVARLAQEWNHNDNLGLVVGATQVESLRRVRQLAPDLWILAPGVGAQGGDLARALEAGLRQDGLGLLVPVSRAISRAPDPRQAAQKLLDALHVARRKTVPSPGLPASSRIPDLEPQQEALADGLLQAGCVKFGKFTLKSGLTSPIYIDLRQLASYPSLLAQVAAAYLPVLRKLHFERMAALPYAALPIVTAISLQSGWPMLYPRKESKAYGTKAEIEGLFEPGETAVVIDDLATTGGSKFEAIEKLASAGLQIRDVVVLIDRQSGASESLAQAGYQMHAVFTLTQLLDHWEQTGQVPAQSIQETRLFLEATGTQL